MCNFRKFNIGNLSSTREPDKRSYRLIPLKDCLILSALWSLHCNLLHFIKKLLSALVSSKISEGLYYILSNSNEVLELDRVDHGSDDAFEFVGLDCEMVGSGRHGKQNMLARCTLVTISDEAVNVIYDNLVLPTRPVTDYRTQYSGMTSDLFVRAPNQISCLGDIPNKKCELVTFSKCQEEVRRLLDSIKGKKVVVVGHGVFILKLSSSNKFLNVNLIIAFPNRHNRSGERLRSASNKPSIGTNPRHSILPTLDETRTSKIFLQKAVRTCY